MIAKLEQFVHRLSEDQAFRDVAAHNPESAVALYGLSGPERQGALKLCARVSIAGPRPVEEELMSWWW